MATPDTRHSIVIKKLGTYRGGTVVWSNRYHFEGDLPPDDAHWATFADAIVAAEKLVINAAGSIIEAVGYNASTATSTNPHGDSVWQKAYATTGTFAPTAGDIPCPTNDAALIRYSTPARSSRNHPVYLMNYYHAVYNTAAANDMVAADQKTAYETYADHWISGFSDGAETHVRCGPRGAVALARRVDPFVRHRDFPG